MKKNLLFITLLIAILGKAQVGINNGSNAPAADLDIVAATTPTSAEGFLLPKVSIGSLDAIIGLYTANLDGVLVNVSDISMVSTNTKTEAIKKTGFYYYDSTTSGWTPLNLDLGNGSFTPNALQLTISNNIDWATYAQDKAQYNYFEFTSPTTGSLSEINMPSPALFSDRTVYFRNNSHGTSYLKAPDSTYFHNGLIKLNLFGNEVLQLYSNGNMWFIITGQNTL